jgi:hypothetical protein
MQIPSAVAPSCRSRTQARPGPLRSQTHKVAGDGLGVRVVLGGDLLPSPACGESLRVGLASDAEAVWEVLMEWGVRTRWLDSRLASDGPR